jgi:hypothetical protein
LRRYFNWVWPTYQRPKPEFTALAGTRLCTPPFPDDRAHRAESRLAPVVAGRRRPTWPGPYPCAWALLEELLPHFAFLLTLALVCPSLSTLPRSCPPLCSTSLVTSVHCRRRPSRGTTPPSTPLHVAATTSPSHQPTTLKRVIH